ncbi:Putative AC transposase [Morus notabilis]|uniref:Putative AC transposase n=1 Tax=Morus notabilis TaxID=981085 RepID=W9R844_9ROSA|nr:Putative AC transposase [Morus notabilis]
MKSGSKLKSELDWYLEEPVLPWSEDLSVLNWWRISSVRYPTLSTMARDILAVPISLATSYEAFYAELRPVDRCLTRLDPDLMNALSCTRSWFKED